MPATTGRGPGPGTGSARARLRARLRALAVALVCGLALLCATAGPASAHVVPTSAIQLEVGEDVVEAVVSIPLSDLEAASGIDLTDRSQAVVDAHADAIRTYLLAHFSPTTDTGEAWSVSMGPASVVTAGDPATTGRYQQLQATLTLTPPAGADVRSFDLGYDAIVDRVATHVVIVTVSTDWAGGNLDSAYQAGVIDRDTVTDTIQPLHLDLGAGSNLRGFTSMVALGMQHIQEGTDHQLFLLTLLLPAPLLVRRRRWSGPVPARRAIRRIATITAAFTLGHSVTLALGALGLPVPQGVVEALIAVSILVAAAHAVRPLFPGREAVIAAGFGLIHGLAFSEALRELHLSGVQLVLSLLGFNLGIEAMQLIVVALVLPPLILLARSGRYQRLRVVASVLTAVAALGWLADRLGTANPVADVADRLGIIAGPVVLGLWLCALYSSLSRRRSAGGSAAAELGQPGNRTEVAHGRTDPDHGTEPSGELAGADAVAVVDVDLAPGDDVRFVVGGRGGQPGPGRVVDRAGQERDGDLAGVAVGERVGRQDPL